MPISLDEMDDVKLMNRTDTKFAFKASKLPLLLQKILPFYKVLNIDNLKYSSNKYNLADLKSRNYTFLKTDINDKSKLIKYFEKFKPYAIFNLAAETHVDRSIINPSAFIKSNIFGVYNLLEIFKEFQKTMEASRRLLKNLPLKTPRLSRISSVSFKIMTLWLLYCSYSHLAPLLLVAP